MKIEKGLEERLRFLMRVIKKESHHLSTTDTRLFGAGITVQQLTTLDDTPDLAERIDAFVSRFGRLQYTLGDKLLPAMLLLVGEKNGPFIDNLDRAEQLAWIDSTDQWLEMRQLRNQMVHEYIENEDILLDALQSGHEFVSVLVVTANAMVNETMERLDSLVPTGTETLNPKLP